MKLILEEIGWQMMVPTKVDGQAKYFTWAKVQNFENPEL